MALRTFNNNPSLGGFGGGDNLPFHDDQGDAFCQILKELVDNAVDACRPRPGQGRVRVTLEEQANDLLRVTVTDNGCGMPDIAQCVNAFHTSKAVNGPQDDDDDNNNNNNNNDDENSSSGIHDKTTHTSGRYGIGLTLCLLHAQRLVPHTKTSIKSATAAQEAWNVMTCVVDAKQDAIQCFPEPSQPKTAAGQSGTSVSLLVPGGPTAILAWPRLAEYFARFQLCLDLPCRLEVSAPSLSSQPLCIRPVSTMSSPASMQMANNKHDNAQDDSDIEDTAATAWRDPTQVPAVTPRQHKSKKAAEWTTADATFLAAQHFLDLTVTRQNFAHVQVPIRCEDVHPPGRRPQLDVSMIVYGAGDKENEDKANNKANVTSTENPGASMVLIRLVNQTPMLDTTENVTCGLVQGIVAKQNVWSTAALNVSLQKDAPLCVPTYAVQDSKLVVPFLKRQRSNILPGHADDDSDSSDTESDGGDVEKLLERGRKRSRKGSAQRARSVFEPAHVRMGKILLVVQIQAQPNHLPLPTLCKGRIPRDNKAIDQALEIGLKTCIRQLQKSNPALFLSTKEMKKVERDVHHIPMSCHAIASILSQSNLQISRESKEIIHSWGTNDKDGDTGECSDHVVSKRDGVVDVASRQQAEVDVLSKLLESKVQLIIAADEKKKSARQAASRTKSRPKNKKQTIDDGADQDLFQPSVRSEEHGSRESTGDQDSYHELL